MPHIYAPITCKIKTILVRPGDKVKKNDVVASMEAMNMVINIYSPLTGVVKKIHISAGQVVTADKPLITIG